MDSSLKRDSSFLSKFLSRLSRLCIGKSSKREVSREIDPQTENYDFSSSSSDSETDEAFENNSYDVVVADNTVEKKYEEDLCSYDSIESIQENPALDTNIESVDKDFSTIEKNGIYQAPTQNRVVGIVEIKEQDGCHWAIVVGAQLYKPQVVKCAADHLCYSLVMANYVPGYYFPSVIQRQIYPFEYEYRFEENDGFVILSIEHLSSEDSEAIRTHGRHLDELSLQQAILYIRDPYVAISEILHIREVGLKLHSETKRSSTSSSIERDFSTFYKGKHFESWCGRAHNTSPLLNLNGYQKPSRTKLDETQLEALKKAVCHPGFTVISSPPGSGKTTVIASICHAKWAINGGKERAIVITSSMNCAATEAVLKVKESTKLRVCRKYSMAVQSKLSSRELAISSKSMSTDHRYKRFYKRECRSVLNQIANVGECRIFTNIDNKNWEKELDDLEYTKCRLYRELELAFIKDYNPQVFGTTPYFILNKSISLNVTHLILDESSRISTIEALAIYCACPDVEFITILGDSNQLPPYCNVEFNGVASELANLSEIKRMESLSTVNNCKLGFIYRSHPKLTDMLLRPIYGSLIKSGITESDRSLAVRRHFPVAKDGTPCLFVQIGKQKKKKKDKEYWKRRQRMGQGTQKSEKEKRVNENESNAVIRLLIVLKQRNVNMNDVLIVVHHLDQLTALNTQITKKPIAGKYCFITDTEPKVMTADACQGVEAAVVIVMTTKTCNSIEKATTSLAFICEPHRETVAVSRAREAVYIFGDWEHLLQLPFWNKYNEIVKERGALVDDKLKHI